VFLLLAAVGCDGEPEAASGPAAAEAGPIPACTALRLEGEPAPRPLVFVLSDTLRRDRLGAYGGPAATPHFDAFAEAHHRFTHAVTQSPWTKPSIATLFTGVYPSAHGVLSHPELRRWAGEAEGEDVLESDVLSEEWVTLAEALAAAGYRTAAFVSNPWIQDKLGFAQGFATFDDSFAGNATPGTVVTRAGLRWGADLPDDGRPWFLYLHYMDAHAPYAPLPAGVLYENLEALRDDDRPLSPRAARQIARRSRRPGGGLWAQAGIPPRIGLLELVYDQGVIRFDRALGELLEGLGGLPGGDDAAVVVVSDHGEALFHRGWRGHGDGLYEDETAAPLAARLPGVSGPATVDCPVGLVDLRRTLCDYLGIECPGPDQGVSLLGGGEPRYLVTSGVKGKPRNRAIRNARYKLIVQPDGPPPDARGAAARPHILYDLERDPDESRDLLATEGNTAHAEAIFARLREALETAVPELEDGPSTERVPLDDATRERLEALGYLGDDAAEP